MSGLDKCRVQKKELEAGKTDYGGYTICFFDPSADIDDEFALVYMSWRHLPPQVWVICGDANTSGDVRLKRLISKFGHLFPNFEDKGKIVFSEKTETSPQSDTSPVYTEIIITTLEAVKKLESSEQKKLKFQNGLICGPVGDLKPMFEVTGKLWLQGSLAEKSFNIQKSEDFIKYYEDKGKLCDVPSAFCLLAKPTNTTLAALPPVLKDSLLEVGFKMMVMRMPPHHAMNRFAEGLVNPNAGRGTNNLALQAFCEAAQRPYNEIEVREKHNELASKYINDLKENGATLKDEQETLQKVARMNAVLDDLMPGIWDGSTQLYYSDAAFEDVNALVKGFEQFKQIAGDCKGQIPGAMPLYDLAAASVFMASLDPSSGQPADKLDPDKWEWGKAYEEWQLFFSQLKTLKEQQS